MIDTVTGQYHFRSICGADKELFMALRSEASDYAEAYRHVKSLYDVSWNEYMNREAAEYMMVFRRPEEVFVAECSFQGIQIVLHFHSPILRMMLFCGSRLFSAMMD